MEELVWSGNGSGDGMEPPEKNPTLCLMLVLGVPIERAKYALFEGFAPINAPIFSEIFYVFLIILQYQTKVSKLINWRCL